MRVVDARAKPSSAMHAIVASMTRRRDVRLRSVRTSTERRAAEAVAWFRILA
jgi:hypothetical protein